MFGTDSWIGNSIFGFFFFFQSTSFLFDYSHCSVVLGDRRVRQYLSGGEVSTLIDPDAAEYHWGGVYRSTVISSKIDDRDV